VKRSDIKVGETYGVRRRMSRDSNIVPATVVSIDEPVSWEESTRWSGGPETITKPTGGILVKFEKPTRVGWYEFNLASETNENAGEIIETYAFHEARVGRGQIGRLFVAPWAQIQADRKAADEAERERYRDARARGEAFAPVLDAHMERLKALGLDVKLDTDSSGIYGDIDQSIATAQTDASWRSSKPVAFGYQDVRVDPEIFEWLLDCAEASGQKFEKGSA
jgi:hypothetical protein